MRAAIKSETQEVLRRTQTNTINPEGRAHSNNAAIEDAMAASIDFPLPPELLRRADCPGAGPGIVTTAEIKAFAPKATNR